MRPVLPAQEGARIAGLQQWVTCSVWRDAQALWQAGVPVHHRLQAPAGVCQAGQALQGQLPQHQVLHVLGLVAQHSGVACLQKTL